ncbi:unnamed protein product [Penicillium roqueforti FM164]|uniref:Uncharacterized protein n=1 Tax=Penicillium roqueforti (strain FM164) TaxID=1365484 RepID=W6QN18_PENRF|nr:unnamed protein product [Penicillium roqueforti FM164]
MLRLPFLDYPESRYIRPSPILTPFASSISNPNRAQPFSGRAIDQETVLGETIWKSCNTHCINMDLGVNPHAYTSGRWLRNDKHQRQIRHLDINFDELCRIMEHAAGVQLQQKWPYMPGD